MKKEQIALKRGYVVSEKGIAYNPKGVVIGKNINSTGYHNFAIRIDKKGKKINIHRLQALQKYGDSLYCDGIEVRHFDGNKLNNSWKNILIGTHSENIMDIPKQIRIKKALHAASFNRKHDKEEIIKFYKKCKSYKKTMDNFNISSKGTLHFILNN